MALREWRVVVIHERAAALGVSGVARRERSWCKAVSPFIEKAPAMRSLFRIASVSLFLMGAATVSRAQEAVHIDVSVETGVQTGTVNIVLYDSETAFEGGQPVRMARLDVAKGETSIRFEGLPAGDYALKSFHDVNGNGRMDTNPFGMPIEPFAFSNNAVGNMGPAKWDRAHFSVSGTASQTLILR